MRRRRQYIIVAPWSVARGTRTRGIGQRKGCHDRAVISGAPGIPLRGRTFAISEGTAPPSAVARGAEDEANAVIVFIPNRNRFC